MADIPYVFQLLRGACSTLPTCTRRDRARRLERDAFGDTRDGWDAGVAGAVHARPSCRGEPGNGRSRSVDGEADATGVVADAAEWESMEGSDAGSDQWHWQRVLHRAHGETAASRNSYC